MLIKKSVDKMIERGVDILTVDNSVEDKSRSSCPVIVVHLGEKTTPYRNVIKQTLDENWKNSGQTHHIYCTGKDEYSMENHSGTSSLEGCIEKAVQLCLATEDGVFESRDKVLVNYVLAGIEDDFEHCVKKAQGTQIILGTPLQKVLFVMLNNEDDSCRAKTKNLIEGMSSDWEQYTKSFDSIFLLSNQLHDNTLLMESRIDSNYKIIANTILFLANRYSDEQQELSSMAQSVLTNKELKTIAYTIAEKPNRDIVIATLLGILKGIKNIIVSDDHIDVDHRLRTIFNETFEYAIVPTLPTCESLISLPQSEAGWKELRKTERLSDKLINSATFGSWDLFVATNYINRMDIALNEIKAHLRTLLIERFSLQELYTLDHIDTEGLINSFRPGNPTQRNNKKMHEFMYDIAISKAKAHYYDVFKTVFASIIKDVQSAICKLKSTIDTFIYETQDRVIASEGIFSSIEFVYSGIAKNYFDNKSGNPKIRDMVSDLPDIAKDDDFVEFVINRIISIFRDIAKEEAIFFKTFEAELTERLEKVNSAVREDRIVEETLVNDINNKCRIKLFDNTPSVLHSFYLGNVNSDIVKRYKHVINKQVGLKLFNISRKDYVENMRIIVVGQRDDGKFKISI